MKLPIFYITEYDIADPVVRLDEDTSKHIIQVLRMKIGEQLHLTDGKGHLLTAEISRDHKKFAEATVVESKHTEKPLRQTAIGISLLKNSSRFEWFLEKATELGISQIFPMICERTTSEKFRTDRLNQICISAMIQSQQTWLPELTEPFLYHELITGSALDPYTRKFIGYCEENKTVAIQSRLNANDNSIILIGPEGDFTSIEIDLAISANIIPVSLGSTRLRTETAGMVAATLLKLL